MDTSTPYHIAYTVIAVLYGGYAFSLWVRARRLRRSARAFRSGSE
ncbi:MAG TPA: hypothetical protein VN706_02155 [Gemmatimonadaceae bacterium]|nr:hypothetical protein [Gemmatimonadaceae bacterium]